MKLIVLAVAAAIVAIVYLIDSIDKFTFKFWIK